MRHGIAIVVALVGGFLTTAAGHADTAPASSEAGPPNSGNPFTPAQIAQEFVQLPLSTQKELMKILMSQNAEQEKQDTTEQLDGAYATLPPEVQQTLYQKWNALSDEQRIALKQMNPAMIKALLSGVFRAEIAEHGPDMTPVKKVIEKSEDWAEKGRAYVQKLFHREPDAPESGHEGTGHEGTGHEGTERTGQTSQ